MPTVVDAAVPTDLFLQSWQNANGTDQQLGQLMTLVRLNPAAGICHERFMFVEEGLKPGLYTRDNPFGPGVVLLAYFGKRISTYLLDLLESSDELTRTLQDPATRVSIHTQCEQIFNQWVTAR